MKLPSPDAYRSAIQHPDVAFSGNVELADTRPESNRYGIPSTYSGNFTATFHLCGAREWAVRCYTREIGLVTQRYDAITRFLEGLPDSALTMARLVPNGIVVEGERYDIIQMEWINGTLLNEYVGTLAENGDAGKLAALAEAVLDLGFRLAHLGIAHGDIQHGNVLVDGSGNLRLVDYDDMFIPALAHLGFASGIGQENYQHPKRGSKDYDAKLDRFSFISIYVTLRALAANPELWNEHDGGEDCLIFRKADFLDPYSSTLFQELDTVEPVKELVDRFASICAGPYEEIPSLREFIDGRFQYARFVPKVAKTRAAASPGTRPANFIPDATPVPVRPVPPPQTPPTTSISPLVASSAPPQQSGRLLTILGGTSVFVIVVLTVLGILTHHSPSRVASPRIHTPAAPRARIVAHAPAPPAVVPRRTPQATSAPRATNTPQPTSAPTATSTPAPPRTATPPPPKPAPTAVAKTAPQMICSTPDTPAHVVTLAPAQLSDEKRAASAGKSVIVTVNVAADGAVTDASVKQSADDVTLDFVALNSARHSTYAPAEKSCATTPGSVDVTVNY